MDKLQEAVQYFKQNEGYKRLFKEMKNKYISFGEIKGNIIINKLEVSEKQALSGLMKKDYSKKSSISINLKKLQERLAESKFEGIELTELLKEYFKEEILTKKESIKKHQEELEIFWEDILNQNKNTHVYKFLEKSSKQKDKLYQDIKKYYKKEKELLKQELLNACKGINNLPEKIIRIPVFASKITSNPHGFDKKTLCGRLFILLLCYINEIPYPKNSEELSELYYNNNLLVDDVSSLVLCKNIVAFTKNNKDFEYEEHEGLSGFNRYNEPIFLTLYNLSNLSFISTSNEYKKVAITENPAVFMGIMEKCKIKDFPLVCTYGQVKLAGIMLLDLLAKQDYELFYSGDLDPEGIQIADRLKLRYKEKLNLLGFNKKAYYKNISNVELPENRLQKLNSVQSRELTELCDEIRKNKKASYEEENIDYIVGFIEKMK